MAGTHCLSMHKLPLKEQERNLTCEWIVRRIIKNGHCSCANIPSQLESSAQVMLVTHMRDEDPSKAAGQPKTSSINKRQIFCTEDSPQHSKTAADINLESPSRPMNELPPPVQMNSGTFVWSETMSRADFTQAVSAAYEEEIHR